MAMPDRKETYESIGRGVRCCNSIYVDGSGIFACPGKYSYNRDIVNMRRPKMKTVIEEYGGLLLSTVTAICIIRLFVEVFLTGGSLYYQMIQIWGNGGC